MKRAIGRALIMLVVATTVWLSFRLTTTPAYGVETINLTTIPIWSEIDLSWTAFPGASSYDIYKAPANSGFSKLTSVTTSDTLSYRDYNVVRGKTYSYQVKAKRGETELAVSNISSATSGGDNAPSAPGSTQEPTSDSSDTVVGEGQSPGADSAAGTESSNTGDETTPEPPAVTDNSSPETSQPTVLSQSASELLVQFLSTRKGLITGQTNFPAHEMNGEFIYETPLITGGHFTASKGNVIPTGYSAIIALDNGTMNGFTLFKNLTCSDPGPFYIDMSSQGTVSFTGLSMEVTGLYAQELTGVRSFPITNFWTTDLGDDLPLQDGEEVPDIPFSGTDFKVTATRMSVSTISISNFSLKAESGSQES